MTQLIEQNQSCQGILGKVSQIPSGMKIIPGGIRAIPYGIIDIL
jgi:hypothetical protein